MIWWKREGNDNSTFPFPTHSRLISLYASETSIGEKWPNLDFRHLYFCLIFSFLWYRKTSSRCEFSLLVICLTMSMQKCNRCVQILVCDWQREGMGITDGTWKGMGIKLAEPGSRNGNGNEQLGTRWTEKDIPAAPCSAVYSMVVWGC